MSSFTLTGPTPTVGQFLHASGAIVGIKYNKLYNIITKSKLELVPNSYHENIRDGLTVATYKTPEGQYILSYNGTSGFTASGFKRKLFKAQVEADKISANHGVSRAQKEAVVYANNMTKQLEDKGVAHNNIFVTGYSLGGILSQYTSQQTGLPGIGFEGTGIPAQSGKEDKGNFISVASYGDIVPALASDVKGLYPLASRYNGQGGDLAHHGSLAMLGNPRIQPILRAEAVVGKAVLDMTGVLFGKGAKQGMYSRGALPMVGLNILGHDPRVVAKELGVQLAATPLLNKVLNAIPNPMIRLSPREGMASGNDTLPELAQHINLRH